MQRLAALLSICAFALLFGCGDDVENQIRPVADYMPLQVGAQWIYQSSDGASGEGDAATETRTITEQSRRSGVTWYRMAISSGEDSATEVEFAVDRDRLLMRSPGGGDEILLLRDPVIPGGRWAIPIEIAEEDDVADEETTEDAEQTDDEETTDDEADAATDGADDAETVEEDAPEMRFDILSTSDIVVTPAGTFGNVVVVRSFTENATVAFYYFAPETGMVKFVQETAAESPLEAPSGTAATALELSVFSLEGGLDETDETGESTP